jgi:hypothetical protein
MSEEKKIQKKKNFKKKISDHSGQAKFHAERLLPTARTTTTTTTALKLVVK